MSSDETYFVRGSDFRCKNCGKWSSGESHPVPKGRPINLFLNTLKCSNCEVVGQTKLEESE